MPKQCKDCRAQGVTTKRPAPHPGPRCATHHRAARKRRGDGAHATRIAKLYGMTGEQYLALYEAQGGVCAICLQATGRTRRLAVDHDHQTGRIRGVLCSPCNLMLGRLGETGLRRAINYLHAPPADRLT